MRVQYKIQMPGFIKTFTLTSSVLQSPSPCTNLIYIPPNTPSHATPQPSSPLFFYFLTPLCHSFIDGPLALKACPPASQRASSFSPLARSDLASLGPP